MGDLKNDEKIKKILLMYCRSIWVYIKKKRGTPSEQSDNPNFIRSTIPH
jgi:hypothetical protein